MRRSSWERRGFIGSGNTSDGRRKRLNRCIVCGGLLSVAGIEELGLWKSDASAGIVLNDGTLEITGPEDGVTLPYPIGIDAPQTNMLYYGNTYKGRDAVIIKKRGDRPRKVMDNSII